jgi:hypothetical protein
VGCGLNAAGGQQWAESPRWKTTRPSS